MAHRERTDDPRAILTRSAPPPDFTVAYGEHPDQIADVRLPPPGADPQPLVVLIHGGFWLAEYDRVHIAPAAADLASRGYPVASLEYRRIGDEGGGWPGTFDDVEAGVAAVPSLIGTLLGQPSGHVVLMGHSAGAQLALWAGRRVAGIRGIVALAPVADLARAHAMRLEDGVVGVLLGGGPDDVADRYAAVDPAMNLPLGVPTVVVHGHLDMQVPYPIGRDWAQASAATGDPTVLIDLVGIEHFGVIDPHSPAWPAVLRGLASVSVKGEDSGRATTQ